MVENLVFRMEVGSYQAGPLCLCLYIIWSSWSPQLLHMIWYSGAHWSMANCTVSLFFTSLHIPTFKLLKLELRTWINSSTPSLCFWGKPLGCKWMSMDSYGTKTKPEKTQITFCTQATQKTPLSLCHFLSLFFEVPVFSLWHLFPCLWIYFVSNTNEAASQKLKS